MNLGFPFSTSPNMEDHLCLVEIFSTARNKRVGISYCLETSLDQDLEGVTKGFSLSEGFLFPRRESSRAGSSVWYECLTCTQEVGGSNPPQSTKHSECFTHAVCTAFSKASKASCSSGSSGFKLPKPSLILFDSISL
jgi:hypothetical protein